MASRKLAALIILDGFAFREESKGNAVQLAKKPNFDRYWSAYPHSTLRASGGAVGLPDGQMGNSEVGHLNIGAGRIVYQSLTRINQAINDGSFDENEAFLEAIEHAKANGRALHIAGLLSDGGVHSHMNHLFSLLELAKRKDLTDVYIHAFLDGRDVGPQTAQTYIDALEEKINHVGIGKIATISGRYYAMDRDKRWDRVQLAYDAICYGKGEAFETAKAALAHAYAAGQTDEFVLPAVICPPGEKVVQLTNDDAFIFFNFRPDRAIQLSEALTDTKFNAFDRGDAHPQNLHFVTMMDYSDAITAHVAFGPLNLHNTLGEVIASNHLTQLRIAETEKYPHVTYFMNGGKEDEYPGEKRILIHSPDVATYDLQPEMSAYEVTDALIHELETNEELNTVMLNFANPDMVGHSGKLEPTIQAIEAVDECLGRVVDTILRLGGEVIITADHGNSDEVTTLDGKPMTAHTTNPVPVIVTRKGIQLRENGILADLAPTMLDLLEIDQPAEMTGQTLIHK